MGSAGRDMAQSQPVRSTARDNRYLRGWNHKITAVKHPEINKIVGIDLGLLNKLVESLLNDYF